ncbi:MAG TPA: sulfurtransferase [Bacillus bacterium]|nr:sulfurtransferase [Bacillus sp. (in: firmicutes)]
MKNIVNVDWLYENLENPNVIVIDCRFELGNPGHGLNLYIKEHISGAFYFDLEKDLSKRVEEHGGRHPMPELDRIIDKLGAAGIDANSKVVAYDDQGGMIASRFWWLLKYVGHDEVYILDGGFSKWVRKGYPITDDIPSVPRKQFQANIQQELLSNVDEVKQFVETKKGYLLDSRIEERYIGQNETIDKKAGHIPGALNYFWEDCLNEKNEWKSEEELKERFERFNKNDQIIVYCGSGVSACPNIIALDELGFTNVKLYMGSWSDWITYEEHPIAIGLEE